MTDKELSAILRAYAKHWIASGGWYQEILLRIADRFDELSEQPEALRNAKTPPLYFWLGAGAERGGA